MHFTVSEAFRIPTLKHATQHSTVGHALNIVVPAGKSIGLERRQQQHRGFVVTPYNESLLTSMIQDHAINKDICIVGEKGMGKTAIVTEFAGTYCGLHISFVSWRKHLHCSISSLDRQRDWATRPTCKL
jgi:midasin (ATPase involved in ribosome maturation)